MTYPRINLKTISVNLGPGILWKIFHHCKVWHFSTLWLTSLAERLTRCLQKFYQRIDASLNKDVLIKLWKSSGYRFPDTGSGLQIQAISASVEIYTYWVLVPFLVAGIAHFAVMLYCVMSGQVCVGFAEVRTCQSRWTGPGHWWFDQLHIRDTCHCFPCY